MYEITVDYFIKLNVNKKLCYFMSHKDLKSSGQNNNIRLIVVFIKLEV